MKAIKIILAAIVAIITILIILGVVFFNQLNQIVEQIVETTGSDITQTSVEVQSVDITLKEGRGELKGLSVANPLGFSNDDLFKLGDIALQIDVKSVLDPVKVIDEISIDGVSILAEQKDLTKTNIQALIDNVNSSISSDSAQNKPANDGGSGEAEDIRLFIKSLNVGESEVLFKTEKWGDLKLSIPGYTQANIGNRQNGSTADEIGREILSTMLSTTKKTLEEKIKAEARAEIEKRLAEEKAKIEAKVNEKLDDEKAKLQSKLDSEKEKLEEKIEKEGLDVDQLKSLFN